MRQNTVLNPVVAWCTPLVCLISVSAPPAPCPRRMLCSLISLVFAATAGSWQGLGLNGAPRVKHKKLSKADYNGNDRKAKIKKALYSMFVPAGSYAKRHKKFDENGVAQARSSNRWTKGNRGRKSRRAANGDQGWIALHAHAPLCSCLPFCLPLSSDVRPTLHTLTGGAEG